MTKTRTGVDYSEVHRIDSPANRRLRTDIWAEGQDIGQQSFATLSYFDDIADRLGIDATTRVLDLGSGTGGPAIYIAERTGCRMTGLEVNRVGIEVAERLVAAADMTDRVDFVQADGMSMPFEDGAFDVVICMNVMNVFADKVALLREVRRVLRPGGTFTFLSGTFAWGPGDDAARERIETGYAIPQYTDSLAGYKAKLIEAGFAVDEVVEYISDFGRQMRRWRDGWTAHRDILAAEQGAEQTDHHIDYFNVYLALVESGKASNHLITSHRPED